MMRHVLVFVLALWSTSALAHDARSSAVELDVIGSAVTVHVAATQAGLHRALEHAAGHTLDASDAGYRVLVADHLRRTIRLSADGAPLAVGEIGLRLGDHQSDARFVVELPDGAVELSVTVESFDGVEGQQTALRIRQGGEATRAVLSQADGQTLAVPLVGSVSLAEANAARAEAAASSWLDWIVGLGLAGLAASLPLLLIVRRRSPAAE